jgi:hypothetical protein
LIYLTPTKMKLFGIIPLLLVIGTPIATAMPSSQLMTCYLRVDGKVLVNGQCSVFPLGANTYTLNTWKHSKPKQMHFAQVTSYTNGDTRASWNEDPKSTHAWDDLGSVRFESGCWVNDRVKICATL